MPACGRDHDLGGQGGEVSVAAHVSQLCREV